MEGGVGWGRAPYLQELLTLSDELPHVLLRRCELAGERALAEPRSERFALGSHRFALVRALAQLRSQIRKTPLELRGCMRGGGRWRRGVCVCVCVGGWVGGCVGGWVCEGL